MAPKPVKRPATAGNAAVPKKTQQKKQPVGTSAGKGKVPTKAAEKGLTQEEVDEKAAAIFSEEILSGLSDADWKTRLSAVEQLTQVLLFFMSSVCGGDRKYWQHFDWET
jgi:cytoskeleton-associated protein 5